MNGAFGRVGVLRLHGREDRVVGGDRVGPVVRAVHEVVAHPETGLEDDLHAGE